jgi:hypothetical protein
MANNYETEKVKYIDICMTETRKMIVRKNRKQLQGKELVIFEEISLKIFIILALVTPNGMKETLWETTRA